MENENSSVQSGSGAMKFSKDYLKRTIWIGLAFFGILLVWQLYNTYCSPMLAMLFAKSDYPDKIAAASAVNLTKMKDILAAGYITSNDYLKIQWKVGIIMALDNIAALFMMPLFGNWSDKTHSKLGKRMPFIIVGSVVTAFVLPLIPLFFNMGMENTSNITAALIGMICTMVVVIMFMMSYRSPAVALMPDLTPKPLRSRANGIINVVGYAGGAIGAIFGIVIPVTSYMEGTSKSLWTLEVPFLVSSVVLLVSLALLLIKVKENKLHEQLDAEIARGDAMGESAEQVTTSGKLSKNNLRNLALILVAEVFWFMSLNGIETFQTNYLMFHFNTSSGGGAIMTVLSGAASVCGFLIAGPIADKIGRKWTIMTGICTVVLGYAAYALVGALTKQAADPTFDSSFPWTFYIITPIVGLGTSLIHICSFPLVTDYCTSDKLGKFTSLYYTASMLAQSVTPILIGLIFMAVGSWNALPIYSCALMFMAGLIFVFVKAPHKNDKAKNAKGLEALGADD